ncbi:MAG: hypothetical protein L3J79_04930, partial [Candidatus Marinimicrobia bacterium]|nr:hypothetical protein [Candidatus Neomarinimicrobiota bacterium]
MDKITNEEEVYLSFRYLGVIDEIIVAYYADGNIYLPVTELFDLFAINYDLNPSSFSVSGNFIKEDAKYVLDFSKRFAKVKDEVWLISANDYLIKEVDFFLNTAVFAEVFGLDFIFDLSRLTIQLETRDELPIITRYTRRHKEELRQKYGGESSLTAYEILSARDPRLLDGALFDYTFFSSVSESNRSTNLNVSLGGELVYGDVQGTVISRSNQDTITTRGSNFKWRFVDESQPWFSTITLGQQSTSGLANQTFQGAQITNQPLVPKRSYDTYAIDGTTEPEAEVELYQDNRLVEVINADDVGYYRFMVPLNYGISDYKIRIYARQGRVIELERRVQI